MGMSVFYASQGNVVLSALIGTGADRRRHHGRGERQAVSPTARRRHAAQAGAGGARRCPIRGVDRAPAAPARGAAGRRAGHEGHRPPAGSDLQAQVTEATQLARADTAQRQTAKTEAARRLAALAPLRQRVEALQSEVDVAAHLGSSASAVPVLQQLTQIRSQILGRHAP